MESLSLWNVFKPQRPDRNPITADRVLFSVNENTTEREILKRSSTMFYDYICMQCKPTWRTQLVDFLLYLLIFYCTLWSIRLAAMMTRKTSALSNITRSFSLKMHFCCIVHLYVCLLIFSSLPEGPIHCIFCFLLF